MNSRVLQQIRLLLLPQLCTQPLLYSEPTSLSEVFKSLKYKQNEDYQLARRDDVLMDKYYII